MVGDGLVRRHDIQHHRLTGSHARDRDRQHNLQDVNEDAFDWMTVDSAPAIGDIQSMMSSMHIACYIRERGRLSDVVTRAG